MAYQHFPVLVTSSAIANLFAFFAENISFVDKSKISVAKESQMYMRSPYLNIGGSSSKQSYVCIWAIWPNKHVQLFVKESPISVEFPDEHWGFIFQAKVCFHLSQTNLCNCLSKRASWGYHLPHTLIDIWGLQSRHSCHLGTTQSWSKNVYLASNTDRSALQYCHLSAKIHALSLDPIWIWNTKHW